MNQIIVSYKLPGFSMVPVITITEIDQARRYIAAGVRHAWRTYDIKSQLMKCLKLLYHRSYRSFGTRSGPGPRTDPFR